MKKTSLIYFVTLFGVAIIWFACSKKDQDIVDKSDPAIEKFLESSSFLRVKSKITDYGSIYYNQIQSGIIKQGDIRISVIGVPVFRNGRKIGIVEIVDLETDKFLPNGDSYAMNYQNLEDFNLKTLTGLIEMVDLNYSNAVHSRFAVENNRIKSFEHIQFPKELGEKYGRIKNSNKIKTLVNTHACDGNGNGNVSFWECYGCITGAIEADGFSSWMCDVPVAGWMSCWATTSAACVYLSAKY